MSVFTNIALGLRYVLPIFPFLYVGAGRLVPWVAGLPGRWRWVGGTIVAAGLVATATATAWIHPHYLAYFNQVAGGPENGSRHLIDSNLDWGQDLVGLKRWLDRHAPGERVGIAYFGQIPPAIFAVRGEPLNWFLPPARPRGWGRRMPPRYLQEGEHPPAPGLYAVSASLVRGLPWRVYDSYGDLVQTWAPYDAEWHAFDYFAELKPFAKIGYSIFLYRVTPTQAANFAQEWGGETREGAKTQRRED